MKKLALAAALWFCLSAWLPTALLIGGETENPSLAETAAVFKLPTSLIIIEEGAFENTAAETVILPEKTEMIGDRGFAENRNLKTVLIPRSVTFIGDFAFEGSPHLTIKGAKDSYAAAWARVHDISFVKEESGFTWLTKLRKNLSVDLLLSLCLCCVSPGVQYWQRKKTEYIERSMRPQDRSELYPINYRFP